MIVLRAITAMSETQRILQEAELSERLDSNVVIIPHNFEIVSLDYIGDYEEVDNITLNNELQYHPDDVRLNYAKEAIERVEEHYNSTCSNGCRCNG